MTSAEEFRTAARIIRDLATATVSAWPWDPGEITGRRPPYWEWVDLLAPQRTAGPLICILETAAIDAEVIGPDYQLLELARAIIGNARAVPA